jgi:hypothetical protein
MRRMLTSSCMPPPCPPGRQAPAASPDEATHFTKTMLLPAYATPHNPQPQPKQLLKGNTFAGSAFFSYGSFWISWAFFQTMTRLHPDLGFTPDAGFKVGECILRAAWGFLTFGFFVPTLRKNGCLMVVSHRTRAGLRVRRAPAPRMGTRDTLCPGPLVVIPCIHCILLGSHVILACKHRRIFAE